MIYIVSLRELEKDLINSNNNLSEVKSINHWKVANRVPFRIKKESKHEHYMIFLCIVDVNKDA